ncbi:NAD(P)-dependent alcohol dehydrogenase [Yersinia nurmii]|uniref:alcohol dehydrogenase (NADP(+)) n=1 Tax=Yersinia nurmii TaxID=685706 RepID=A0AAW7K290_9GAMM|nr:NAD(P)-dependent alcohol dehydrogenase [Yersinia nurmii]MDN0086234.1 NAD(P)-dependent alcohol dehydrogenase [Yersinia nurmii]CNE47155.1 NADP-dependent alcohol dehydrogenase [Yersinia nurmii]
MSNQPVTPSAESDNHIHAWAAPAAGQPLESFAFDAGPLADDDIEVSIDYCGVCHSDLSMINNDWGITAYPFVPGHEVVGKITRIGEHAKNKGLKIGQVVGVGWNRGSCMHCHPCVSGDQHLCHEVQPTIIGRHGGFADRIRSHWAWAIPLPDGVDIASAGPLFCGGITVFNPLLQYDVRPTQRVGVVGIGGLGHMAIRFMKAWGCEVTAFTSSNAKRDEALSLGAHRVVASNDSKALAEIANQLDFILVTANASLDWDAYVSTLAPKGRLHFVGAIPEPVPVHIFAFIGKQAELSASPTGAPARLAEMLAFCARHDIKPQVEHFPLSKINDAIKHLHAGKARYRVVLDMHA